MTTLQILAVAGPIVASLVGVIASAVIYHACYLSKKLNSVDVLAQRMGSHEEGCDRRWQAWETRYSESQTAWGKKWDDHFRLHDAEKGAD